MPISGFESSFQDILLLDLQLIIPLSQVYLREYLCPFQLVKQIIYPWKLIFILYCHFIQLPIINTEMKGTILYLIVHEVESPAQLSLKVSFYKVAKLSRQF